MISFPNAKINIGLSITGKRDDGFHNISTLMIPTSLCDALEFIEDKNDSFAISGINIQGNPNDNLVMKALNRVREKYRVPHLRIHLHKKIPSGAGLGGGSSDASFMIRMLDEHFKLGMQTEEMKGMAASIGSDCSFFIKNIPQMASGRGDLLKEIDFHPEGKYLAIFQPDFSISTHNAYEGIKINEEPPIIEKLIKEEISEWRNTVFNEFENKIFKQYPEMNEIKKALYQSGAIYASMTGSGSALYAIYNNKILINKKLESILIHHQIL